MKQEQKIKAFTTLLFMAITILCFNSHAQADNYRITGTVSDDKGDPLPGASIIVKDSKEWATSDIDGKFVLVTKKKTAICIDIFICRNGTNGN